MNFAKYMITQIFAKFKYFARQTIFTDFPHKKSFNWFVANLVSKSLVPVQRRCSVWVKKPAFPFIFLFMKFKGANFA